MTAAVVWHAASVASGLIIRSVTRRMILYGVLASAVLFLALMRIYAEILIHTSLWMYDLREHKAPPSGTLP